jgi:hypothetical protein
MRFSYGEDVHSDLLGLTLCGLVVGYQRSSEMLVPTYKSTWPHNPEDHHRHFKFSLPAEGICDPADFDRHKYNKKTIEELQSLERCHTHIQEYSKQNRHGDMTQHWSENYRQPNHQEDQDVSDTLFPAAQYYT